MKKIKVFLKSADIFSEPISLLLYKEKKYSTFGGGILTILMIIMLFLFSKNALNSVFYRTNINLNFNDLVNNRPAKISLKNRFALSVTPLIYSSLLGKRYFDYQFILGKYDFNEIGSYVSNKMYYNLTICNKSHFPMFSEDQLKYYQVKNWLCPDFNSPTANFDVLGTYNLGLYQYIQINILECQSKGKDDICANESEIYDIRNTLGNGKMYADLVIMNNILNYSNHEEPFTPFKDQIENVIGINNSYLQREIHFTAVQVETDQTRSFNFVRDMSEPDVKTDFIFERKMDSYTVNENMMVNGKKLFVSIYLRSGTLSKMYHRSYDCLENYMQVIGSLNSIFYFAFLLVNKILTRDNLTLKIAKNIYDFPKKKREKNERKLNMTYSMRFLCFALFRNIKNFFYKIRYKQKYQIEKIKNAIFKDMDLIQLLIKVKEMENFKRVLLTDDQKILLNFIAKPKFEEQLKIKSQSELNFNHKLTQKNIMSFPSLKYSNALNVTKQLFYSEVSKAYQNLTTSKNEMDQKILALLDSESLDQLILEIRKDFANKKIIKFTTELKEENTSKIFRLNEEK